MNEEKTTIVALENGSLMIKGNYELLDHNYEKIEEGKTVYLCRCGQSTKKPFCDGTHNRINFKTS
jgi:CDGSH-type Zn-finger protein